MKKILSMLLLSALLCFSVACKSNESIWTLERVYGLAVENGYQGTFEEFFAQLHGQDGLNGKDGLGISSAVIDENGHLILTLTDGSKIDAGSVIAPSSEGSEGLYYQETVHPATGEKAYLVRSLGAAYDLDIVVPAQFNGCPVVAIGDAAFAGYTALRSVVLPDSVLRIGDGAFSGCAGLISVQFGGKIESIGAEAFLECDSLTAVRLPDSVQVIGEYAFSLCRGMTSLTLGGVERIETRAFEACSSLVFLEIPSETKFIGAAAFNRCEKLTSVLFENPKGWSAGTTPLPETALIEPVTAASYLTATYRTFDWIRN